MPAAVHPVSARSILASFGRVLDPRSSYEARAGASTASPDGIEIFFSHVWGSSPKSRLIGILWYLNWHRAVLMSVVLSILSCLIMSSLVDGRSWTIVETTYGLTARSILALIGSFILVICLFICEHILPRHNKCFLDRCSIDQASTPRKLGGMREIPSVLANSRVLVVLLSDAYFNRLWCVYEIAIFKSTTMAENKDRRRIVFVPLRVVMVALLMLLVDLVSTVLFRSNVRSLLSKDHRTDFIWISATFSLLTSVLLYGFSFTWFQGLDRYRQQLSNFSLANAQCTEEADRDMLTADIEQRFKGVENFEKYVQTEILSEIGSRPRVKYLAWICIPSVLAVLGYVNVITQRMGLFCFTQIRDSANVVKRDDSFCVILDRSTLENVLIMMVELMSRLLYYPVVIRLTLLYIKQTRKAPLVARLFFHLVGLSLVAVTTYIDSLQYENPLLVIGIEAAVMGVLAFVLWILPAAIRRYRRNSEIKAEKID